MTFLEDRIAMADVSTQRLDEWFERLERMPSPKKAARAVAEAPST